MRRGWRNFEKQDRESLDCLIRLLVEIQTCRTLQVTAQKGTRYVPLEGREGKSLLSSSGKLSKIVS